MLTRGQRGPRRPCLCFTRAAWEPVSATRNRGHRISFGIRSRTFSSLKSEY
ncbi:hypothetical protein HanIR_Chr10g0486631 [Helianthus annuus]|nr:hypothetical protein HanIR_Chr10g0486631 [Helianthus annuus]